MTLHLACSWIWSSGNLMFFLRYFLLSFPTMITAIAWFIWGGSVYTAPYGFEYQTVESTELLATAGFLSSIGCTAGWLWSFRKPMRLTPILIFNIFRFNKFLLKAGITLVLIVTILFALQNGSFLGITAYQSEEAGAIGSQLNFHIFNIFIFTGIACLILVSSCQKSNHNKILWFAALSLVVGLLKGNRADFLPQLIILIIFIYVLSRHKNNVNKRLPYKLPLIRPIILFFVIGGFGFFLGHLIAVLRYNPEMPFFEAMSHIFAPSIFINEAYGASLLWIETGNMMIGGMYSMIVKVGNDFGGFLLGSTYLNWFLTLPPAFLGLDRPEGLEWQTDIGGQVMTQGGIFEVAEAYANFGLIGCFCISFLISRLMGGLLRSALANGNILYMLWFLTMGFMGLRAIWYQNFGYFRIASIYLIALLLAKFICPSLLKYRKGNKGEMVNNVNPSAVA
jgi:hypothetical protein